MLTLTSKSILHIILFAILFVVFPVSAIATTDTVCTSQGIDDKSDAELERIIEVCEQEKQQQALLLNDKQRESVTIERDLSILNYKISQSKSEIRAGDIKIRRIAKDIVKKGETIDTLSVDILQTQASIGEIIRKTNELDDYSFVEAVLSRNTISAFFIDVGNFNILKDKLHAALVRMKEIKGLTQKEKEGLTEKEQRERGLKLVNEREKKKTESYKSEKDRLLALNREEEAAYKKNIAEKETIKQRIRSKLFRTVGGVEISFGDALDLIQPYEERIGVETALVLAVLFQESGRDSMIGGNLGACTYNQPKSNKDGTVMRKSQWDSFLTIMSELGMDPNTTKISCPIPRDGAYGGAMGPSQFMPSTWWDVNNGWGYKKRISKVLGIANPSPFVNLDAFIGTALYLSDARERCDAKVVGTRKGFTSQFDIFGCSSAKYYSGLGSSGSRLAKHMNPTWSYGYKVAARAQQFQRDIDTLNL